MVQPGVPDRCCLQSITLSSCCVAVTHVDETSLLVQIRLQYPPPPPTLCLQLAGFSQPPFHPTAIVPSLHSGSRLLLDFDSPGSHGPRESRMVLWQQPSLSLPASDHLTTPSVANHQVQKLHLANLCSFMKPAQGREDGSVHQHLPCKLEDLNLAS